MKNKVLIALATSLVATTSFASESTATPGIVRYGVVCSEMQRAAEVQGGGAFGMVRLRTLQNAEYLENEVEKIRRAGNEILDVSAPAVGTAAGVGAFAYDDHPGRHGWRRESPIFVTTYCVTVKYRKR